MFQTVKQGIPGGVHLRFEYNAATNAPKVSLEFGVLAREYRYHMTC